MMNDLLLYMRRNGNNWRMDIKTYTRFMKYVHLYFREMDIVSKDIQSKLAYVEIPAEDLSTICFLFGGYSRDNETMMLTETFPKIVILPWKKFFTLNLYTEDNKNASLVMYIRE